MRCSELISCIHTRSHLRRHLFFYGSIALKRQAGAGIDTVVTFDTSIPVALRLRMPGHLARVTLVQPTG